jgi:hypothetical protein
MGSGDNCPSRRGGTIEKVVWQLLPMSISPPRRGNRKSAIPASLGQAMIVENLRRTRRR